MNIPGIQQKAILEIERNAFVDYRFPKLGEKEKTAPRKCNAKAKQPF